MAEATGSARAAREADMAAEHCRSRRHLQRGRLSAAMGRLPVIPPASVAKGFAVSPSSLRLRHANATVALLVALLVTPALARAQGAGPAPGKPTIAVEDTLYMDLPEEIVRSPRVTIDEILRRVA